MHYKTFLIGAGIVVVSGVVFNIPLGAIELFIPSLLFAGILGGIYVAIKRKRPLINCAYDGFLTSMPASFILGLVLIPLFWFYHGAQSSDFGFTPFFFTIIGAAVLLSGLAGGAFGGLCVGLYYRYLKKDRGELELYKAYIEERSAQKNRSKIVDDN